ncbi:MAG: beta-L-arabinofuranosidase domain-containing protein, partial [Bacillota bacterium]
MISPLRLPKLEQVRISDRLWSRYTDMVADVIIPYQWKILNDSIPGADPAFHNWNILDSQADNFMQDGAQQVMESYCIKNFRIAAGELEGEHKGVIFVDTDVYKWLETVAYCLHNGSCKDFESIADEVISLIGRAQQPDGYLNTYFTVAEPQGRWSNLVEGHELYCAGYLIEAGVAYYEATGKSELLNTARRFADLICKEFGLGEGQRKGYPGHQEIELALVKLYRCTGQRRYLNCARFFIDERGQEPNYFRQEIEDRNGQVIFPEFREYELKYSQSHMPPRR